MDVRPLLADGRLPFVLAPALGLVVVADEEARLRRERQQLLDRAVEGARVAAGEVGPRRAVVGHEQGVAAEDRVADPVGDAGRGVARRVEHRGVDAADLEGLAVDEEVVELAAVAGNVGGVEHRPEDLLDLADMLADTDLRAGLQLDIGGARQVVGMGMGLEHPLDGEAVGLRRFEDRVGGPGRAGAGRLVVVEDRVDHHRPPGRGVADEVARRVGRLVEEGADRGFSARRHGRLRISFHPVLDRIY